MRRRAGLGAIQKHKLEQEKYKDKGTELQENQFEQMTKQLEVFKVNLEEFATKHKNEIRKNPEFRRQFQEMCASIGVDPLSSGKGFWSVLGIGDFYYELAVQIVEVCLATNYKTGGLIGLNELRSQLIKARGKGKQHQEITQDDLIRAAQKLRIFGSGFTVVPVGKGQYMVQSILKSGVRVGGVLATGVEMGGREGQEGVGTPGGAGAGLGGSAKSRREAVLFP